MRNCIDRMPHIAAWLGVFLLLQTAASPSARSAIVDVNALLEPDGIAINLGPGSYIVSFAGTAGGGIYDAWDPWGNNVVSGCSAGGTNCAQGWTEGFIIKSAALPGGGAVYGAASSPYYATATQALAAFQTKLASGGLVTAPLSSNIQDSSSYSPLIGPIEFTLSSPTSVNFFVADTPGQYGDNGGGVSLSITSATPLPPALPLFATGLGIAGLLGWRTKRNNEPASAT